MTITSKQKFELKRFIKELESHRGRHTELVTVYVPAGYDLTKVINHLADEQGTASNIKSTSTRKNVIDALERMIQHLRVVARTPKNGLAAFSGNVAEREGQSDVKVWSIEPPVPLNVRIYRCDKEFVVDPLQDMCADKEIFGLVVMDRRDAIIAELRGKSINVLVKTHSEVPGKFRAGGQSAQRFERNRELAAKAHYKKVADYIKEQWLGKAELRGIIVGGPGPTKYEFAEGNYITDQLKQKIIAIKDLSYTEEFGLQELIDRSQDVLASEEIAKEKAVMQGFFALLHKKPGMVAYGKDEVRKFLDMGAVDKLILSEKLDDTTMDELEKIARDLGSEVYIISTDTREGVQLAEMGKVVATLRYEANI